MYTTRSRMIRQRGPLTLLLGTLCVASSFSLGMFTSASVQPTTLVTAGSNAISGDLNSSGDLDLGDIRILLEITQGYRDATAADLIADFDENGTLTVDDAIRALQMLATK